MRSSGVKVPPRRAFSTFRSIKSSFPEATSAFICLSQSSSGKAGRSSAINSQYSSGESLAMASLISPTVDTMKTLHNLIDHGKDWQTRRMNMSKQEVGKADEEPRMARMTRMFGELRNPNDECRKNH